MFNNLIGTSKNDIAKQIELQEKRLMTELLHVIRKKTMVVFEIKQHNHSEINRPDCIISPLPDIVYK